MGEDYIPIEAAAELSGLHPNTLRRLLREGVLRGYKAAHKHKMRWFVSVRSLRDYTDPVYGFLLELRGPKLFLKKLDGSEADE
jgi:hypothetical protein